MAYFVLSLREMIKEIGEDECKKQVANFSCPLDYDIEYFLIEKAILFENLGISRTYLVYASYKNKKVLVGYFAIANKTLIIREDISKTMRKKLTGFKSKEVNTIPVYLIGQLAKNYNYDIKKLKLISGQELLRLAFEKILKA